MIAVADEEIEGINDVPLVDTLGAANAAVLNESKRSFGSSEATETELAWPDGGSTKFARTIVLSRPGLTLFLMAVVGESKLDAYSDTISKIIDSLKPRDE
jgi:hypothetical protein